MTESAAPTSLPDPSPSAVPQLMAPSSGGDATPPANNGELSSLNLRAAAQPGSSLDGGGNVTLSQEHPASKSSRADVASRVAPDLLTSSKLAPLELEPVTAHELEALRAAAAPSSAVDLPADAGADAPPGSTSQFLPHPASAPAAVPSPNIDSAVIDASAALSAMPMPPSVAVSATPSPPLPPSALGSTSGGPEASGLPYLRAAPLIPSAPQVSPTSVADALPAASASVSGGRVEVDPTASHVAATANASTKANAKEAAAGKDSKSAREPKLETIGEVKTDMKIKLGDAAKREARLARQLETISKDLTAAQATLASRAEEDAARQKAMAEAKQKASHAAKKEAKMDEQLKEAQRLLEETRKQAEEDRKAAEASAKKQAEALQQLKEAKQRDAEARKQIEVLTGQVDNLKKTSAKDKDAGADTRRKLMEEFTMERQKAQDLEASLRKQIHTLKQTSEDAVKAAAADRAAKEEAEQRKIHAQAEARTEYRVHEATYRAELDSLQGELDRGTADADANREGKRSSREQLAETQRLLGLAEGREAETLNLLTATRADLKAKQAESDGHRWRGSASKCKQSPR